MLKYVVGLTIVDSNEHVLIDNSELTELYVGTELSGWTLLKIEFSDRQRQSESDMALNRIGLDSNQVRRYLEVLVTIFDKAAESLIRKIKLLPLSDVM